MTDILGFLTESADEDRSSIEYRQQAIVLELSERVLDRLEHLGISQAELARRLGVSRPMITKLLTGDSNFQIRTLLRLADALKMDLAIDLIPQGFSLPRFYISSVTNTVGAYTLPAAPPDRQPGRATPKRHIVQAGGSRNTADYSSPIDLKVA